MPKPPKSGFLALAVSLLAALNASASGGTLPSAATVFDRYLQATGGRAAWQTVQMQREEIEGRSLDGERVVLRADVTKARNGNAISEMTVPEVASEGVFKGVAWSWTKLAGPRIRKGPERATAIRGTRMLEEADWRSLYPNSKVDGAEPVAGKLSWRVSLLPSADGKLEWFDLETGLLTKRSWWEASTSGPVLVTATVESWQTQNGLRQPASYLMSRDEMQYRVTVLKSLYSTAVRAEALRYPDEVASYLAEDRAGRALPNAEEIIERHIFASGGAASYQSIKTQKITGTLDYLTRGMVAHTEVYSASGGRYYQAVDLPGMGKQEEGSDGSVVWERSPILGPRAHTRRALNGLGVTLDAAEVIGWRYLIGQARTEALEKVDGRDCYRVRITAKKGESSVVRWYEKSTGLLYRTSAAFKSDMGEIPTMLTYEGWRQVEGLRWPVKIRVASAGQDLLFTADEVALNTALANNLFDIPEDVKKLAEAHADRVSPIPADMQ